MQREPEGRRDKAGYGKARTRELKLGCLFTQTRPAEEGCPVPDPGSSTYLATIEPAEWFGGLLDAEARRCGCERVGLLLVVFLQRRDDGLEVGGDLAVHVRHVGLPNLCGSDDL